MRKLLGVALPLAILLASPASAVEIEVGGRTLEIPIPSGFAELTPEMSPTYETIPRSRRILLEEPYFRPRMTLAPRIAAASAGAAC